MIRRTIAAGAATSVAAALLVPWGTAATAAEDLPDSTPLKAYPADAASKGTVLDLAAGPGKKTYIVQLEGAAVPTAGLQKAEERGYAS